MSDWKEYTLEELCDFQNGFAFKNSDYVDSSENTNEVFRMGYINRGGGFKEDTTPVFVPKNYPKNLDKFILKPNDITIAMTDMKNSMALLGYCARISHNNRFVLNQRVGRIRVVRNDILNPIYLYYYLNSSKQIDYLRANANSGVQVNLSTDTIKKSILKIPSIEKQRKIANILFALDQKIELNSQINQILEQIAQALFKSWFVDFGPVRAKVQALSDGLSLEQAELAAMQAISGKTPEELTALSQTQPERYAELAETAKAFPCEMVEVDGVEVPKGWEVTTLGDLISFVKGKKPKAVSPNQEENMLPHILTSSLEGKYNEFCESNKLVTVEYHNTIMLMDGSNSGRVAIGHNGVIGSTLAKINLENNKLWAIIYQFLKHKEADIQANTTGTTIPHTDKNRVNNYLMTIPNDFLLDKFTKLFDNSLLKIISNRNQIISLETIRDLLLPRLLNGEIE